LVGPSGRAITHLATNTATWRPVRRSGSRPAICFAGSDLVSALGLAGTQSAGLLAKNGFHENPTPFGQNSFSRGHAATGRRTIRAFLNLRRRFPKGHARFIWKASKASFKSALFRAADPQGCAADLLGADLALLARKPSGFPK